MSSCDIAFSFKIQVLPFNERAGQFLAGDVSTSTASLDAVSTCLASQIGDSVSTFPVLVTGSKVSTCPETFPGKLFVSWTSSAHGMRVSLVSTCRSYPVVCTGKASSFVTEFSKLMGALMSVCAMFCPAGSSVDFCVELLIGMGLDGRLGCVFSSPNLNCPN